NRIASSVAAGLVNPKAVTASVRAAVTPGTSRPSLRTIVEGVFSLRAFPNRRRPGRVSGTREIVFTPRTPRPFYSSTLLDSLGEPSYTPELVRSVHVRPGAAASGNPRSSDPQGRLARPSSWLRSPAAHRADLRARAPR